MEFDIEGKAFYIITVIFTVIMLGILMGLIFNTLFFDDSNEYPDGESSFICVETTSTSEIVYHKETKVMYAVSTGRNDKGVFTMLVDEEGNPMIWEE